MIPICALLIAAAHVGVDRRAVAITFDDLPAAGTRNPDEDPAMTTEVIRAINTSIVKALTAHGVPATAFVNERGVATYAYSSVRRSILAQWTSAGMDLANHTWSHADFNRLSVEEFEQEIDKGEPTIRGLMADAGKKLTWFRFPMNHTGADQDRRDAIAKYLAHPPDLWPRNGTRHAPAREPAECRVDRPDPQDVRGAAVPFRLFSGGAGGPGVSHAGWRDGVRAHVGVSLGQGAPHSCRRQRGSRTA